jgi:hypothetical protein
MEMILKAHEKEVESRAWELWLTLDRETKNENPFGEFLKKLKEPQVQTTDTRTEEQVLQDAEHIVKLMKRSE